MAWKSGLTALLSSANYSAEWSGRVLQADIPLQMAIGSTFLKFEVCQTAIYGL